MEHDLRADAVATLGIAMAAGSNAQLTVVRDRFTRQELGRYDARRDRTRYKK
jgi:hypothetical protein